MNILPELAHLRAAQSEGRTYTDSRIGELAGLVLSLHESGSTAEAHAVTIPRASWTNAGKFWQADVPADDVTAETLAVASVEDVSDATAVAAGLSWRCTTYDGGIRFFASKQPAVAIALRVMLIRSAKKGGQPA